MNPMIVNSLVLAINNLRSDLGEHDQDETLRSDMIEGETDLDAVLSKLVRRYHVAKADGVGAKAAKADLVSRYDARIASADKRQAALRNMMRMVLEASDLKGRKLPEGSISLTPGKASLVLADDFSPPQGYRVEKIEPDTKAIKSALESGAVIDGASLQIGNPIVTVR